MQKRRILEFFIFFVAFGFLAYNGYQAYHAYQKQAYSSNYSTQRGFIAQTITDAESGDAQSQFALAELYRIGNVHLPQDHHKAIMWYEKSANQNNIEALFISAHYYHEGIHVQKDAHKAITYYTKAAEGDHAKAKFNLAILYEETTSIPDHLLKAAVMYKEAAESGDVHAQHKIGRMYLRGAGFLQDYNQARYWLEKALTSDPTLSRADLAYMYYTGSGVAKDIMKAGALLKKSIKNGDSIAQNYLDNHINNCRKVFSVRLTEEWLETCIIAAEAGDKASQYDLASIILQGDTGSTRHRSATDYLAMAAHQQHFTAQITLARAYGNGEYGAKFDVEQAYFWLVAASCNKEYRAQPRQTQHALRKDMDFIAPKLAQHQRNDLENRAHELCEQI